jgi:GntR family transcriptional regulator
MDVDSRLIDRAAPLPLWAQVLDSLRERMARGEFAERFPTDSELVAQYTVSRQTVREAVRRLSDEGRLERTRGRGTRVTTFEQVAGSLESLYEQVRRQHGSQQSEVRSRAALTDPSVAARLGLAPDAELVHIERLRLADGEPLALDRAWLPATLARPLLSADLTDTGLYVELVRRCGIEDLHGRERIRPLVPSRADREALAVPAGEAVFSIERLTLSGTERPVEWRHTLVRGDRYTISIESSDSNLALGRLPWARA